MPENCAIKNATHSKTNGFKFLFRTNSCSFCTVVGGGCVHLMLSFTHLEHEFEITLYRSSSWNSFSTALGDTHPRSHCRDLRASSFRFLESSHRGVSGIYNNGMKIKLSTILLLAESIFRVNDVLHNILAKFRSLVGLKFRKTAL